MRAPHGKPADMDVLIQQLIRAAIQQVPAEDGVLYDRLIRGVERELLEQVLPLCDNVLVKAAAHLGINRNTLHKKLVTYNSPPVASESDKDEG